MSLTKIEEQILDLYDNGHTPRQIERKGFTASAVRFVINAYGGRVGDLLESKRDRLSVQNGSRLLLEAIKSAKAT